MEIPAIPVIASAVHPSFTIMIVCPFVLMDIIKTLPLVAVVRKSFIDHPYLITIVCSSPCLTCSGSATSCTGCQSGSTNPLLYNQDCISTCPDVAFQSSPSTCAGKIIKNYFCNPYRLFKSLYYLFRVSINMYQLLW